MGLIVHSQTLHQRNTVVAVIIVVVQNDWLIELRFYVPPDKYRSFWRRSYQSLGLVLKKTTQQKQTCIGNKIHYNIN